MFSATVSLPQVSCLRENAVERRRQFRNSLSRGRAGEVCKHLVEEYHYSVFGIFSLKTVGHLTSHIPEKLLRYECAVTNGRMNSYNCITIHFLQSFLETEDGTFKEETILLVDVNMEFACAR